MMQHPDDQTRWYCPHCGKKLIEYPGFPFIIVIVGMIVGIGVILNILPSKASFNKQDSNQPSSETSEIIPDFIISYDKSMDQVSRIK